MQYIKFYATVLFFCGALWCRAQESTYTLSGVVMDADHEPVYGATVKVGTQTTISDSEGQYRISDIRQRQVRIEASAVGFSSHVQTLTLTRSEEHASELQSREKLVCRLLLEKKKQG